MEIKALTNEQKDYGKNNYLNFSLYNGFSVALIAESTLILYALKIGVPDYIIGIMASFLFLGVPFMIIGKRLVLNAGVSKTLSRAWFFRSILAFLTFFAPIAAYFFSLNCGIAILLIGAFGFYACRGIGMIAISPMLGEITDEEDVGEFNAKAFFKYNFAYTLSILVLIIIFNTWDSIITFQVVLVIGCILGLIASYYIAKVPETDMPKKSASISLASAFIFAFRYSRLRKLIYGQTVYLIGVALILPYSMLALKESYKLTDYEAFKFVLAQFIGAMLISYIIRKVIRKLGARKLLILIFFFQILAGMLWLVSPKIFNWLYCSAIFLVLGMAQFGGYMALMHYFLDVTPPESRIGSTIIVSAVSSIMAGICGAVIGGGLLRLLETMNYHGLDKFHYYFTVIIVITIAGYFFVLKLEKINILRSTRKIFLFKK